MHSASARLFACGVLGTLLSVWSHAADADALLTVGIPPQPVAAALSEFAHQTGLQLLYVSQVAQARASKGATAGLSAADALTALLDGTGLSFQFINARTVRIFESPAVAPTAPSTGTDAPRKRVEHRAAPISSSLDEILVTGSRDERQRSAAEYIQNVPASVSLVSGESLIAQKSETLVDYAAVIPGFHIFDSGYVGWRSVILRGIYSFTQASSVAYYLDDAPMGANGSYAGACCSVLELTPYDLERLEVLRGPQGTLYGQQSMTGLIRYVLKAPSLTGFEGRVGADLNAVYGAAMPGNSFRAMANVPVLEDVLGLLVSGYETYTPGYIDNLYTGAKDINALRHYGGRIATLWRPSESFSLTVSAFWNRTDADDPNIVAFAGSERVPNTGDAYVLKPIGPLGDLKATGPVSSPYGVNIAHYSATASWNPGSIAVVSTTSWSRTQNRNDPQLSGSPIPAGVMTYQDDWDLEKFSEELRLVSATGGRLEWSLGGFYTHESSNEVRAYSEHDPSLRPTLIYYFALPATYSDKAVFGDLTWRVTGQLDLTGGLRYDRDSQAWTATIGGLGGDGYSPNLNGPGEGSEGITSWMASARYHFTPDMMLYARAATGYQPSVPPTAKPETLINYELGLKSEFLDRRALFDLTVFYIDWINVQIPAGDAPLGATTNSGHGRSEGLELVSAISPFSGLQLGYIAAYIKAGLTRVDPAAPAPYPAFLLAGYQTLDVPKWSFSVTADYDWQPTDRWHTHLGGVLRWVGQQWAGGSDAFSVASVDGQPVYSLPSYEVLDLKASIARGPLTLRTFARNITDRRAWLNAGFYSVTIIQPRTIGVGFDYAF
jgi:outer membrane receptor protein involved in Fe transport